MSLGSPVIPARLAIRGVLRFVASDGSIVKEVEIVDGSLPIISTLPVATEPEQPDVPHHP
jgi:hypothetical protein